MKDARRILAILDYCFGVKGCGDFLIGLSIARENIGIARDIIDSLEADSEMGERAMGIRVGVGQAAEQLREAYNDLPEGAS